MALTKQDLKQIGEVVEVKIKKEIDELAGMIKKEFDANTEAHEKLFKEQQLIRDDISHLEFITTEMVRRDELLEVKQRLSKIEVKLGLAK